jgi:hypothetical protein
LLGRTALAQTAKEAEVVLSDWLTDGDDVDRIATNTAAGQPYYTSSRFLESLSLRSATNPPSAGLDITSAPFRFQRLISALWRELRTGGALDYLDEEGQVSSTDVSVPLHVHTCIHVCM